MCQLSKAVLRFVRREDGPTAVEYAIMLALIILVCIAAISIIGTNTNGTYRRAGTAVNLSS